MNLNWVKPSRCESNACLEVAFTETGVHIRESQWPDDVVFLPRQAWADLMAVQPPEDW